MFHSAMPPPIKDMAITIVEPWVSKKIQREKKTYVSIQRLLGGSRFCLRCHGHKTKPAASGRFSVVDDLQTE
jgi:hypothetical protein